MSEEIRKTIVRDLNYAQNKRKELDLQNPEQAIMWHRHDAVAAYINSLVDIVDVMIKIDEATKERIATGECKHNSNGCHSNGCHFDGYCRYRKSPDPNKMGNGFPTCGFKS